MAEWSAIAVGVAVVSLGLKLLEQYLVARQLSKAIDDAGDKLNNALKDIFGTDVFAG